MRPFAVRTAAVLPSFLLAIAGCGKPPVEPPVGSASAGVPEPPAKGCSLRFTDPEKGHFEARLLCRGVDRCRLLANACLDPASDKSAPFVDGALVIGEDASNTTPCRVGLSGDVKCLAFDATKLISVADGAAAHLRLSVPDCTGEGQSAYANPKLARDCAGQSTDALEQGVLENLDARGPVREWRGSHTDDLTELKEQAARDAERREEEAKAAAEAARKKALGAFRSSVDDFIASTRLGGKTLAYDWLATALSLADVTKRCPGDKGPTLPYIEPYFPKRLVDLTFPADAPCALGAAHVAKASFVEGKLWRLELESGKVRVPEDQAFAPSDWLGALHSTAENALGAPTSENAEGAARCSSPSAHCVSVRWVPEDRGSVELGWDDASATLSLVFVDAKLEKDKAGLEERARRLGGKP